MRGMEFWHGTVQGPNGVFNNRLTLDDFTFLKSMMVKTEEKKYKNEENINPSALREKKIFEYYEADLENSIKNLMPKLGLILHENGYRYPIENEYIDFLCKDEKHQFNIILLKKGKAPQTSLLRILKQMSWVRQHLSKGRDVKGIILTEKSAPNLVEILGELPNIELKYYRFTLEVI